LLWCYDTSVIVNCQAPFEKSGEIPCLYRILQK
jgi:hypothetical protein